MTPSSAAGGRRDMRIVADDEKIVIGDNRNAWSARQLQRTLSGSHSEIDNDITLWRSRA